MENIKIGSFNTKDNAINRNGGFRPDGLSNAVLLSNMIKEQQFDLLGTQELTIAYVNQLMINLDDYRFYGSYRYGDKILLNMPYNENNNIITKQKALSNNTIWLPWIANNLKDLKTSIAKMSIMPRIATIVITESEKYGKVCMINTHLDYQIPSIQIRQLEALKKLVLKYQQEYPVILTGDFNVEKEDKQFGEFITNLRENNIERVDIGEKTWFDKDGNGKELDHIFVPKDWSVLDAGTIETDTSDHKLVYVETRRK